MHPQPYPTRPTPEPALHLLGGLWVASCPVCGFQLTSARTQQRCERRAARRRCPVCHQEATQPSYRGLQLDGPLREFHRAVDRLRWDTISTPLDHQPPTPPAPPRRRRHDPSLAQACLPEPPSTK